VIQIDLKEDKVSGIPRLSYSVDHTALQRLTQERLGRTVLVSDHSQWSAPQIVEAYRSLSVVEDAFKNMKKYRFSSFPKDHITKHKPETQTRTYARGKHACGMSDISQVFEAVDIFT